MVEFSKDFTHTNSNSDPLSARGKDFFIVLVKVLHDFEKWKTSISIYFSSLLIVFCIENCITSPPHATSAMLDRTTRWHKIPAEFWSAPIHCAGWEGWVVNLTTIFFLENLILLNFQWRLVVLLPIHKYHGVTHLKRKSLLGWKFSPSSTPTQPSPGRPG